MRNGLQTHSCREVQNNLGLTIHLNFDLNNLLDIIVKNSIKIIKKSYQK